jgi:hypothetical protein
MSALRTHLPSAAGSCLPTSGPGTTDNAISAERTPPLMSLDAVGDFQPSDSPHDSAEQTSSSAASASLDTASPHVPADRTSSSASSDNFPAPPRPAPTSRPAWIGTTHARRLLDVGSENTIKSWVRYGYLRGRRLPNGRTQVLLDDVLRIRDNPALLQ